MGTYCKEDVCSVIPLRGARNPDEIVRRDAVGLLTSDDEDGVSCDAKDG